MDDLKQFEEEIKALKIEFVNEEDIERPAIRLEMDLDTAVDYSELVTQCGVLRRHTKRGAPVDMVLSEYTTEKDQELGRLTFSIYIPCNEKAVPMIEAVKEQVGTTFPDLAWLFSEGTTEQSVGEVETQFREMAVKGDLTWLVPCHVIEDLIEVMHVLNQSFLEGILEDAIIYGPWIERESK